MTQSGHLVASNLLVRPAKRPMSARAHWARTSSPHGPWPSRQARDGPVARPPGPRSTSMQEAEPLPSPLCGGGSALLQTTSVRTEALQQGHFEMTFRQTRAGGRSSFIARRTGTPSPLLNSVIQEGPADHQSSRQLCTANKSLSEFRLNL